MGQAGFTPGPLDRNAPVFVAGHRGMVGSAIHRHLEAQGFTNILTRTHEELDLTDRDATFAFFRVARPRIVVLAAALVGGILANSSSPVDFISQNLQIGVNVLDAALEQRVERLLFLGSSCLYPKFAPQPIKEDSLLTGALEPTNDAYAIAKIAGIMQVQSVRRQYQLPWISTMPTNLYGPNDNFSETGSHMLPALIRRYDDATTSGQELVTNWGSGTPRREFLHVDDMASASLHLLENYDGQSPVNIGTGNDHTIREIARIIADAVGYTGKTRWDTSKPDGTPRKLLDVSLLRDTGWEARISLDEGINETVDWYRTHHMSVRV
jgi:GDP-L-fucose synthase